MNAATHVKLHADPVRDLYEVVHSGETVGYYWAVFVDRRQMYRAADRSAKPLQDCVDQDEAAKVILAAA